MVSTSTSATLFKKRTLIPLADFIFAIILNFLLLSTFHITDNFNFASTTALIFLSSLIVPFLSKWTGINKSLHRVTNPFLISQALFISFLSSAIACFGFFLVQKNIYDFLIFFYFYFIFLFF